MNLSRHIILKSFSLLLGLSIFASCSEDKASEPSPDPDPSSSSIFISFRVTARHEDGTRSYTDSNGDSYDGTMFGNDPENEIRSAYIYLVNSSGNIALELECRRDIPPIDDNSETDISAEIEDINELVDLAGQTLTVYVVANARETSFTHDFKKTGGVSDPMNAKYSVSGFSLPIGDFGADGQTMTLVNYENTLTVTIPSGSGPDDIKAEIIKKFNRVTKGEAYWDVNKNNALKLERAVARVEYSDLPGRTTTSDANQPENPTSKDNNSLAPNRYWLGDLGVVLQLYSVQPFNLNTSGYLFRHTAPGDLSGAGSTVNLFGTERVGSTYTWIASPWWSTGTPSFLNPLKITTTEYMVTDGTKATSVGETLVETASARKNTEKDGYHPLFYIPENTLKSVAQMKTSTETSGSTGNLTTEYILTKYATGVAFKFLVLDNTFKNILTYESEEDKAGEDFVSKYPSEVTNSVTPEMPTGAQWISITNPNDAKWIDVKPEKVIIGGVEKTAYTITYIACIVHNDGAEKASGSDFPPMYYGVVRNNTYQISVNSITGLPLPQDPRSLFLEINCKIADWNDRWDDDATLF